MLKSAITLDETSPSYHIQNVLTPVVVETLQNIDACGGTTISSHAHGRQSHQAKQERGTKSFVNHTRKVKPSLTLRRMDVQPFPRRRSNK